MSTVVVARLDSAGDVLICGPAVRAAAARADRVIMLVGPQGAAAAALLPGVDDIMVWPCPWILADPPAAEPNDVAEIVRRLAAAAIDEALILTSFHQSALPTALLLRLAGVGRIAAASTDYAGSLLDLRLPEPPDRPEPERMMEIAEGAGYQLPPGDDRRLRVAVPAGRWAGTPGQPFVVAHPGASAPSRTPSLRWWQAAAEAIVASGRTLVITGSAAEAPLCAAVAEAGRAVDPGRVVDAAGACTFAQLARLLADADAVVVGNTGPAHLAAAVGTAVVSLFSPVVPAARWAPMGAGVTLLGNQHAICRGTRSTACPVPGHPCLDDIPVASVLAALDTATASAPVEVRGEAAGLAMGGRR